MIRTSAIVLFVAGIFIFEPLKAVSVDLDGYFRTRGNYHFNLDMNSDVRPQIRYYQDFRFRLNPDFYITDNIRVHTSFNLVDAAYGDSGFRGLTYSNPAQSNDVYLPEASSDVGNTLTSNNQTNWIYGGIQGPDAAMRTTNLSPMMLRRAWLEVDTDYGVFRAGRMPYDFGLGIVGFAGDGWDHEIGSTRDRITFETGLGSYYIQPGLGWMFEGSLDQPQDDFWEFFVIFGRRVESQEVSLYLSLITQDDALDASTNGDFQNTKTSYWLLDLYGRQEFAFMEIQGEIALFAGDYLDRDLLAVNAAVRGDWKFTGKYSLLTEAGFSSGTSQEDLNNRDFKTYAFNRDYNISYLVFEEALPGGRSLNGDDRSTAPHSGAISNAFYGRLKAGYELASWFVPYVNIVLPYAHKRSPNTGAQFYGVEYSLITMWPFHKNLTGELLFAHFLPSGFYDNVSNSDSTFLIRAALYAHF